MKNIKTLSNVGLVKAYKEAKTNFRNAIEGTSEEIETDRIYSELFNELNQRDLDLRDYTETSQATSNNTIKKVKTFVKSLVIATTLLLTISIPVMAKDINTNQDKKIIGVYTESNKDFYIEKGDVITEFEDLTYYVNSDVNIQSIDKLNDTVTIEKNNGELYSFFVDKDSIDSYYLNEAINVTIDNNNNEVVDCIVDTQPIVYKNVSIITKDNELTYVNIDNTKYSFITEEDGWNIGEKCIAIIQDGRLLEVRPVPLAER